MPSKCTKCGKVHPDNSNYLLNGCDNCGSKFFFFIRQEAAEKLEESLIDLTPKEIEEIERDVRDIIPKNMNPDDTVVLDLEAIQVIKPGKYRIDVSNLFKQNPVVIRVGPGKYELDFTYLTKMLKIRKSK
ncbi:MAG: Zn-ribbon containing protein [Candidatus Aenigmatarchaeota archaeon]|nr:Zn-ribbon domain-containing protein [Nanoarchaeota archaeon]